ncbi:MAG: type II toxin-antitoxin system YoeB family toxin [Elusimicrobia bacterium]|nr:type II toxin-antitoxin system YoeB family toxin [Elusimicrobiota bacterium]
MAYEVRITRQARKDIETLVPKLRRKLHDILVNLLARDPYAGKKLLGDLAGSYSVRLTLKDRVVYSVDESSKTVYIERARTHYGDRSQSRSSKETRQEGVMSPSLTETTRSDTSRNPMASKRLR